MSNKENEHQTIVILSLTENNNTLTREVPYPFAIKFLGTGFQRVSIVEKGTDVILDLEENGDIVR